MQQYLALVHRALSDGIEKKDRTGTGTKSIFGHQMRFDLSKGFPLITTKKIHFKSVIVELLWFLRGDTNIKWLNEHGVTIWDEWADPNGNLGPVYGQMWRSWPAFNWNPDAYTLGCKVGNWERHTIDQIANVAAEIRRNPNSRRLIVTAWNPALVDKAALPPCHILFQFYVADGKLSCQLYQRSADIFLGVPFNIASYSALTMMLARVTGLLPGEFIWSGGDCHLYLNHLEQAKLQLTRQTRPLPVLSFREATTRDDIFGFEYDDFMLMQYDPHPHIKAPVAV